MEGFKKTKPFIKNISFPFKGKMKINLVDGREIIVPLTQFPSIKRLNSYQRGKWYVLDGEMFSFDDCNEVFHIEQVLGIENTYKYNFIRKKARV
ncbi:MAG: hypothetical protein L0Y79_00970 [Chlorobi bacterium]|nr:hypothetical protein [Chlorobiota bacterium]MCI0716700.1 hypothetical protein [Chlorobiota bacterium]